MQGAQGDWYLLQGGKKRGKGMKKMSEGLPKTNGQRFNSLPTSTKLY